MALPARLWRAFVRLFGMDACPAPQAAPRHRSAQTEAVRARLARRLRRR